MDAEKRNLTTAGSTDPAFKNIFQQTPAEGGVCSPCHVSHKAGYQSDLWAGPVGPVILEGWETEYKIDSDIIDHPLHGMPRTRQER